MNACDLEAAKGELHDWEWAEEEFLKTVPLSSSLGSFAKLAMIAGAQLVLDCFDKELSNAAAGNLNLHDDGLYLHACPMDNFIIQINLSEASKWVSPDMSKDDAIAIAAELHKMAAEILASVTDE